MPPPDDLPGASDPTPGGAVTVSADRAGNGNGNSNGHDNGHGPGGPGPRPGRPPGPSTKPALIVVGLTVVLFLIGIGLELASGSQSRPTPSPARITTARGAVLRAVPARPLLKAIVSAGEPPDDLLDALAVPAGSTPVPSSAINRGVEAYDQSLRFEVSATQQDVITFFRAELPALHWARLSQGPTGSAGTQYLILEQHPASDGHEWDLGVTVAPTFFAAQVPASSAPGAGTPSATTRGGPVGPGSGTTSYTLRLFSVSDQD
jgi:hypothetical protein